MTLNIAVLFFRPYYLLQQSSNVLSPSSNVSSNAGAKVLQHSIYTQYSHKNQIHLTQKSAGKKLMQNEQVRNEHTRPSLGSN